MRRARLQTFAVVHHRLHAESGNGARKLFLFRLPAREYGDGEASLGEFLINAEHLHRLFHRLLFGGVGGMALLPQKFAGPEEGAGGLFPPHDVRPLVDEDGQIAVGLQPLGIHFTENRLACRADDEGLGERFAAADRHDRNFRRKSFDVLRLARHIAVRDKQREIGILMPRRLDARVQLLLDVFPDGVTVRTDYHRTLDGAVIDEFRLDDDVRIPTGKIRFNIRDLIDKLIIFRHMLLPMRAVRIKNVIYLFQYTTFCRACKFIFP